MIKTHKYFWIVGVIWLSILSAEGVFAGPASVEFDPIQGRLVSKFQSVEDLEVSGVLTAVTGKALIAADGMTLTSVDCKGRNVVNEGWTASGQINVPDVDQELDFTVEATVAQLISIGFVESGANPYLQGQQIGADNEIDVPAGAKLRIQRMQRGGAWAWWCTVIWGVPVDGGADD